jgi:hypothetical protein
VRRLLACALAALVLASARVAGTEDVAPVMPGSPSAVTGGHPDAPIAVPAEDAANILRSAAPPPAPPAPAAASSERTITFPDASAPPANPTPHFLFEDVTDRPVPATKTLEERRIAVEALRRALAAGGRRP